VRNQESTETDADDQLRTPLAAAPPRSAPSRQCSSSEVSGMSASLGHDPAMRLRGSETPHSIRQPATGSPVARASHSSRQSIHQGPSFGTGHRPSPLTAQRAEGCHHRTLRERDEGRTVAVALPTGTAYDFAARSFATARTKALNSEPKARTTGLSLSANLP
jgi:hypothetical protein